MKVVAFILSAYLLFLVITPCCAVDKCPEDKMEQAANHEKSDGDCRNCSPFFTCIGCAGFTLSVENLDLEIIPAFPANHYSGYIVSGVADMHYDFWQPPRLT